GPLQRPPAAPRPGAEPPPRQVPGPPGPVRPGGPDPQRSGPPPWLSGRDGRRAAGQGTADAGRPPGTAWPGGCRRDDVGRGAGGERGGRRPPDRGGVFDDPG